MPKRGYGQVEIRSERTHVVVRHDPRVLIDLLFLKEAEVAISFDLVHLGYNEQGQRVDYRVIGWDADKQALIAERFSPPLSPREVEQVMHRD